MNRLLSGSQLSACVCFVLSATAVLASRSVADNFPAPAVVADSLDAKVVAQLQTQSQINADEMFDYLLLKIDELDRVCQLTPEQKSKLKTAAKGAVDRALAKWTDLAVQTVKQAIDKSAAQAKAERALRQQFALVPNGGADGGDLGLIVPAGAENDVRIFFEGWNVVAAKGAGGQINIAQLNDNAPAVIRALPGFVAVNKTAAEREALWTSTVKNTLSPDQWRAEMDAAAARESLSRETFVEQVLTEIDRQLLIDPAQRPEFAKAMRTVINTRLRLSSTSRINTSTVATTILSRSPSPEVEKILSPRQISYWKLTTKQANSEAVTNAGRNYQLLLVH